jgi:hypothetical protein
MANTTAHPRLIFKVQNPVEALIETRESIFVKIHEFYLVTHPLIPGTYLMAYRHWKKYIQISYDNRFR